MAFVRLLRELIKDKEIGGRFVPIIPDEARTFGMDSMFPTQKIYNPNGQQYTSVDAELMLAYRESEQGQLLHEGINEAGSVGSFTAAGTVVRHARRADDPGLRLLLDVRLPAHRRLDLGRGRPDGPRVPRRRHRRAHHAHRRGPAAQRRALAAAGRDQPGRRGLRPGVLLRDRAHRQGRAAAHVRSGRRRARRRERHLLPDRLQRALRAAGRAGGPRRRRAAARHLPLRGERRAPTGRRCACSRPAWRCRGPCRPATCWPSSGAWAPRCGR